jgi:hypothetical protein
MYIRETGRGGMDWIHAAQDEDQLADSCEHGNESSDSTKRWDIQTQFFITTGK